MSSSFHTLEEGMKITLYLMLLQEPFAFPTSCSLQPPRLRGGRSPLPPGAAPLRGRAPYAGAAACPAQNTAGLGGRGEGAHRRKRFAFPEDTQVRGGSGECPSHSFGCVGNGISPGRALPRTGSQGHA